MPVENRSRLTSGYGYQAWRGYTHTGVDFGGVKPGKTSPVYAAADGVVELAADGTIPKRTGPQIKLRHPDGSATVYGHTRHCKVRRGQRVRRGDRLADTWHTGLAASAGVHLHFEWWADADNHDTHHNPVARLEQYGWTITSGRLHDEWDGRPTATPPTITPASTQTGDWSDMATKAEIKAAFREVLAEHKTGIDLTDTTAWRVKDGRQQAAAASRVLQEIHGLAFEGARAAGATEAALKEVLDRPRENENKED